MPRQEEEEIYDTEEHTKNGHTRNQEYIEEVVAEKTGVDPTVIKNVFNSAWDAICHELEEGNSVKLHGKGHYYLSPRSRRVGRNPATLKEYEVPEREAMAFRTSPAYAKRLRKIREAKRKAEAKSRRTNRSS